MFPLCRRRAFTLVELLVTFMVLGILTMALNSVVTMVRASGYGVRCLASQRQAVMGCIAYSVDHKGGLPALYLREAPMAIFWTNLILQDYLEANQYSDGSHTNFQGTALQGCPEWKRNVIWGNVNPAWQCSYGMNSRPFWEGNVSDNRGSNFVKDANAMSPAVPPGEVRLQAITRQSSRLFLADAVNVPDGTSTYLVSPVTTVVTETSNITKLKSWHRVGNLVTITMFDGHGEKRTVTTAATAMSNP